MTYAFPHNTVVVDKEGGIIENHRGMELRDYFAAKAMQALIIANGPAPQGGWPTYAERTAYLVADAMMVAREK